VEASVVTVQRKILYSAITLGLVFLVVEGTAQVIWRRLQARAFEDRKSRGERMLRNDAINFMKEANALYGYTLKAGKYSKDLSISEQRFPQQETFPIDRRPGYLRVVCLGESTTFGNSSVSNYPVYLREILQRSAPGFDGYEVINGGVPGWISDQVALRVKYEVAQYQPDVVILYVGWNDFQSYDPLGRPSQVSYFESAYGAGMWKQRATGWLKSVALASAWRQSRRRAFNRANAAASTSGENTPARRYQFLLQSLDRMVSDFRTANPKVRVFVCTLVGRWPEGTPEEWAKIPTVWWMKQHNISPQAAVQYVEALNELLRTYARSRGLDLIDVAAAFQTLDRAKLQWDWAHMTSDGYQLMAQVMFSELQKSGSVRGRQDPEYQPLVTKYRIASSTHLETIVQ
jgi:lysophospholipase L1-like esterase